jgi:raffinose/stachyose/melibiose transport system permease protein
MTAAIPREVQPQMPVRHGRRRVRRSWIRATIISLVLAPICFIWIYPFLWMVSASLKSTAEIFSGLSLLPLIIYLDNFTRAWNEAHVGLYFINTVFITVMATAITLLTVSMIGYVLGRYRFRGKRVIIGVFAAAIFLPEGYTIIPIFNLLNLLHLSTSLWGIILAEAGGTHIVMVLLFAGYFSQLPKELEESAMVDGAGFLRIFLRIYLPLAKPVIATCIIFQFIGSWNDFLLPLVVTLTRPELRTLAVGIYSFEGQYFTDWPGMAAASTIALLPIIAVFLFMQRYFVEGIAGAVKQ